jgi:rhamnulokinase
MEVRQPVINEKSLAFNFTNEGGVGGTFRLLRNVMGLWLVAGCQRAWQREGRELRYHDLIEAAAEAPPFKSLINPDDERFLAPDDMLAAIRSFCRETEQPGPETVGEFVRCCLESLALKYALVIERLEALTATTVSTIHVVGGGSQNRLLNQFTADATGKTVVAGPVEATAAGNALVQALGLGYLESLSDVRGVVRRSFEMHSYEPHGDDRRQAASERVARWLL